VFNHRQQRIEQGSRVVVEFDLAAERARVADLRGAADEVLGGLRDKLDAVRQAQQNALATTAEATSRDGSVRAVVDATGVVTSLVFAPSAFERSTPEKLAQASVATIQAAAAQARARVSETMAPVRAPGAGVLAAAARAYPELSPEGLTVPAVPHTATDPSDSPFPSAAVPSDARPDQPEPVRRARPPDDTDAAGSVLDDRSW
jgi:DNA-binding protein YbaB